MAEDPNLSSLNDETLRNAQAIGDSMVESADAAKRLNQELSRSSQLMVNYSTIYSGIKSSSNQVARIQDKARISSKAVNDATKEQAKNLTAVRELNSKIEDLYSRARKESGSVKEQLLQQAENLSQGRDNAEGLAKIYGDIAEDASKLNSQTAFFTNMADFVSDIKGLRILAKPFQDAAKASRETVLQNAKIVQHKETINKLSESDLRTGRGLTKERLKQLGLTEITGETSGQAAGKLLKNYRATTKQSSVLATGMKGFAKSAATGLLSFIRTGGWIGFIVTGVKKLVNLFIQLDNRTAQVAQALNMTRLEAANLGFEISKVDQGIDYFTQRLGAGIQLAASFARQTGIIATNIKVFNADLDTINRRFELSEQQTAEMAKNMIISGQSAEEFAISALGAAEALEMQTGVNIQNQAIMRDIAELSATQFLNLKGQPGLIANAVTQARRLGLTMAMIEGTQSSLLNFSQSITDEINAEILLGRQLNLDRARAAALQNDYATVAEEIVNNLRDQRDFNELNFFEQTALAKALGMSRDDLAKSVKEQMALEAAGFRNREEREKKYNSLRAAGLTQQQALEKIGMAEYTRMMNNQSVQEQINILLDNMKILFLEGINPLLQEGLQYLMDHKYIIKDAVEFMHGAVNATVDFVKSIIDARKEGKSLTTILKEGMGEFGDSVYRVGLFLDGLIIKPIQSAVDLLQGSFKMLEAGGKLLSGDWYGGLAAGKEALDELNKGAANFFDAGTNILVGITGEGQADFFNKLAKGEIKIDGTLTEPYQKAADAVKALYEFEKLTEEDQEAYAKALGKSTEDLIKELKAVRDSVKNGGIGTNVAEEAFDFGKLTKKEREAYAKEQGKTVSELIKEYDQKKRNAEVNPVSKAAAAGADVSKKINKTAQGSYIDEDGRVYPIETANGVTRITLVDENGKPIYSQQDSLASEKYQDTIPEISILPPKESTKETPTDFSNLLKGVSDSEKTNKLIERLIQVVERGGDVYLDSRKVGQALVMGTNRQ